MRKRKGDKEQTRRQRKVGREEEGKEKEQKESRGGKRRGRDEWEGRV